MDGQQREIRVPSHKNKERLDTFLARELAHISRNQIQKLIRQGYVTVGGQNVKPNHLVSPAEIIRILIPKPRPQDVLPKDIPLDIVHEDDYLLVVNKKAGMVVHPAYGHYEDTLVNALLAHCGRLSESGDPTRPGIVHRLDKDTSGLLVVAKNDRVHQLLARQFEEKSVERCYNAVVWGCPKKRSDTIQTHVSRSRKDRRKMAVSALGKHAITHYIVEEIYIFASRLRIHLGTGRTHQIRVQLSHIGYPVFGDPVYGGRGGPMVALNQADRALAKQLLEKMPRQALHARTLGFTHPVSGEHLSFERPLPEDMAHLIEELRQTGADKRTK
jgi:23S rRNA pseudouridine1911/1915/1917 synthase